MMFKFWLINHCKEG